MDVIIRNQDINKLRKHVGDDSSTPMRVCVIV